MTKKAPKPTAQHMQKLADLMDTRPEGVNLRQVQNTLSVSPTLAKAALVEIGAVEQDGKWVFVVEPDPYQCTPEEPEPEPLKTLNQAVFDGLPAEYRWAAVDANGKACVYADDPEHDEEIGIFGYFSCADRAGADYIEIGIGYDATDWQNSKIERVMIVDAATLEPFADQAAAMNEIQRDFEEAIGNARTKSDFAVALEAERQRVYDAVAIGGTVERLAELTGLHVDDVQMHLDALIVDGAIFREPIIIGYGHKVAV